MVTRNLGLVTASAIFVTGLLGCGGPPTEKDAVLACQNLARAEMSDVVGNPRYRSHKAVIEQLESGPVYKWSVYGEYFYKTYYSGDHELRFDCTVHKTDSSEAWVTDRWDTVCVGCG